ncbi:hypothetical protein GW864_01290 [bacterium]|nr:hypothetical protein [bacterium]
MAYLFNYPLTSLACVLSEIAKKGGDVEIKGDREITKTEAKEGTINPQITTESPNPKA